MLKKMMVLAKKNQKELIKIGALVMVSMIVPETCLAADSSMPWNDGLTTIKDWVTGPIPTTIGAIAIATSCGMLAFGEMGPAAKKTLQIVVGVSGALVAPELMKTLGFKVSGLLF